MKNNCEFYAKVKIPYFSKISLLISCAYCPNLVINYSQFKNYKKDVVFKTAKIQWLKQGGGLAGVPAQIKKLLGEHSKHLSLMHSTLQKKYAKKKGTAVSLENLKLKTLSILAKEYGLRTVGLALMIQFENDDNIHYLCTTIHFNNEVDIRKFFPCFAYSSF